MLEPPTSHVEDVTPGGLRINGRRPALYTQPMSLILQPDDLAPNQVVTLHAPGTPWSGPPLLILCINLPYVYLTALDQGGNRTPMSAIFDVRRHPIMAVPAHVIDALREHWSTLQAPPVLPESNLHQMPAFLYGPLSGDPNGSDPDHPPQPPS